MRRVVVTGIGLVTPLGTGVRHCWLRLLRGDSGIVSLKGLDDDDRYETLPCKVGGLVQKGAFLDGFWDAEEWIGKDNLRRMATFSQYAVGASVQAIQDAGIDCYYGESVGVCIGSGIGSLQDFVETSSKFEKYGWKKVVPLFIPKILVNMAAGHLAIRYGFRGPNHSCSTACTTGNHSIGDAFRFIQYGDADIMIAGGSEASIHPLAIAGFSRIKSLSTKYNDVPSKSSRPFDKDRCGFVIGEGSGIVVLEELEHARARGARIYAELRGYGLSCDAYHITSSSEEGMGAQLSMKNALKHARLKPSDVDYINAHATSTLLGDMVENKAIKKVMLGPNGKLSAKEINVSSTKGATGHMLGAAGAVESIFTVLAIYHRIMPPTLNLENPGEPSEEFDCNYIPLYAQEKEIKVALTNSFGFGGTNASLCFTEYND
ncbi:beta-ketoacyl-acyl-carrier-protein synthase II [Pneumocystis jirovecii RU7]|uniref:3-oxoacyl-[acyl-carrier-protein] synthase n=1 Tax=Pneumocystis jirovecii (strain RU7) TaxID=1408657 RepID=A0A0W4ZHT7_PNEJ7|nr:beta-ketoacyl-acyl-carrier-protein synthase II [Pneumocystis jirovecii RU7]KTW27923.1 beta-ketoacyl-acyl-carrier-protein synthase II [Pneumocystis jirovecii RU7]